VEANSLRTDESALTGESMVVDKAVGGLAENTPLSERTNMVFASTYVTHGTDLAIAVATGMATKVG
jgi:magnesium-transporting ATPase (P-type)